MHSKLTFYIAVIVLTLIGSVGLLQIISVGSPEKHVSVADESHQYSNPEPTNNIELSIHDLVDPSNDDASRFGSILQMIDAGLAFEASAAINEHYSDLSSIQLSSLKSAFLALAFGASSNDLSRTKNVLVAASNAFDELDIWTYLGDAALSSKDWNIAFDAHFRASELENDPTDLNTLLKKLLISSSHLRSSFESNSDPISVKNLYQRLSNLHPNFQRFQYELAIATMKVGETDTAKQQLQLLVYDLELGEAAKQALAQIEAQTTPEPGVAIAQPPAPATRANDIIVPLVPVGGSFIVNSIIDRTAAPLLLDTGASITSLSTQLIDRLGLQPTGQTIRLSTANGITSARIYRLTQLKLGNLILRDMLIAEISLSSNGNFQGLLGTDVLNQLAPKYSYLIDNQQSALIFRKRY